MKLKKLLMILLTTTVMIASSGAAGVYADEIELSDTSASLDAPDEQTRSIGLEEDTSFGEDLTENGSAEELNAAGSKADIGVITAIDAPSKTDYSFDFKMGYDALNKKLPKLTVHIGNKTKQINVRWICDGDYNDQLGKYPFIPEMEEYKLADGVELPRLILTFKKEVPGGKNGAKDVRRPYSLSYEVPIVGDTSAANTATTLPSDYDSFAENRLPKVRDQGATGTCWAHSTIGAIEADLIGSGQAGTSIDLSEMHLAYYMYNDYDDPKGCRKDTRVLTGKEDYLQCGGDTELAANLLSNMVGAADESDFPLSEDPDDFYEYEGSVTDADVAQIRNAYFISVKDSKGIKAAIMEHGGVTASIGADFDIYGDAANNSFYNPTKGTDHAVMLVGWDDNFPKNKFNSKSGAKPKGNGAWLVRNSYNLNDYGLDGYFWMSYEDVSFTTKEYGICVAFDASTDTFDNCYAYDGSVFPNEEFKIKPDDTVCVLYNVSGKEAVKGVGIELGSANATVYVSAYNTITGQYVDGSIHTSNVGFYTVEFDKPLEVYEKTEVAVYVNLEADKGSSVVLMAEDKGEQEPLENYFSTAKVDKGFYINDKKKSYDPRIKLYTDKSNNRAVKVTGVKLNKKNASVGKGGKLTLTATVKPKNATNQLVTWKSSKPKIASVDEYGVVKAKKEGTAKITVKTVDGKKTARCTVTVKKAVKVTGVTLNKKKANVKVGKTITLKATVKPKKATIKEVTWKSSKPKIASVDANGKVKGIKKGTAKITVTTKDGKKKASCTVTVKKR
ncbi:MAG: Ig-like domain-containing protein [Lachnospiraceae bacterium]|nr:Ig-like domain-containing protein [Lachnospiraceae bacterium]